MRLLLIRHAQTTSNVQGLLDSRVPGADLTALGREQAAAVPAGLAARPVSSITVSNMVRTSQTAQPLAAHHGLTPRIDPGLREIEAGDLEMASGLPAVRRYLDVAWAWSRGDLTPRMAGAQDGHEFFDRFDTAIDAAVAHGGEHPVVVSHGASIRVWVGHRCGNVSDSFAADSELHNTGSALIERVGDREWALLEWNAMPLGGAALHAKSGPDDVDPTGAITEDDVH